MADKYIQCICGYDFSPYMEEIAGVFMIFTGENNRMFPVTDVAELIPLIEEGCIYAPCI